MAKSATTSKTVETKGNPDIYVEEFLFRGRRKDDDRPTGWHVILGLEGTDPLGRPYPSMQMMNSDQAIAKGWDVPQIIAEINQELAGDLEAQRAKVSAMEQAVGAAQDDLRAEQETTAMLSKTLAEAKADAQSLQADLAVEQEKTRALAEQIAKASDAATAEAEVARAVAAGEV